MDGLKELVDAFSSRVRSPVFGSIVVAFLLWNWQAVFLLLFGAEEVPTRIAAFTDSLWMTKYGLLINFAVPIGLGLAYLVVGPWLNLGAALVVAKPTNMRRDLVGRWAVERAQKKALLATELADAETAEAEAELRRRMAEAEVETEKRREELAKREAEIEQQAADARLAAKNREEEAAVREAELKQIAAEAQLAAQKREEGIAKREQEVELAQTHSGAPVFREIWEETNRDEKNALLAMQQSSAGAVQIVVEDGDDYGAFVDFGESDTKGAPIVLREMKKKDLQEATEQLVRIGLIRPDDRILNGYIFTELGRKFGRFAFPP